VDARRVADIARTIATAIPRRRVAAGFAALVAAAPLAEADTRKGGKKKRCRVAVCHKTGTPEGFSFQEIRIACSAVTAHVAHGDTVCIPPACQKSEQCDTDTGQCDFQADVEQNGKKCRDGDAEGVCSQGACAIS
jgi:hypothetical protein